jgi:ATP-dependent exoDNAse (exonuclease V) beta subunit
LKNFVVYKSSAGSGKTFTLVKEYLKLAVHEPTKLSFNFKQILAVTFTNKAAAEMKERIISSLQLISDGVKMPEIGKIICNELKISEDELARRSKIVLTSILHNYSDLGVGTIDSFTHKLVRTFAFDLRLPINFNLELDSKDFYNKVIDELISKIGEDQYIGDLLKEFTLNQVAAGNSWDPETNLKEFTKLLTNENSENYFNKLSELSEQQLLKAKEQIKAQREKFLSSIRDISKKALALLEKYNIKNESIKYGGIGTISVFNTIAKTKYNFDKPDGDRFEEVIKSKHWFKNDGGLSDDVVDSVSNRLSEIGEELLNLIDSDYKLYKLNELLSRQIYSLLLIKKIQDITEQTKQEEQIVFLSEFNKTIFNLINNEPTPFIYERIGERYHHYLLDEFQDTSNLQFQNLIPLLDNSLSNGYYNLIVGDGKQSIYRWRNANVKQFEVLPKIFNANSNLITHERENTLIRNFESKRLDRNFRSTKTIVEFNNHFFKQISRSFLNNSNKSVYDSLEQGVFNFNEGFVSIVNESLSSGTIEEHHNTYVLKYINEALNKGYSYSDICIITRNKNHGHLVANFLKSRQLPIISNESILLKNNLEVNTIIAFLNYLLNENDRISAASVLNYLFQKNTITADKYTKELLRLQHSDLFEVLANCGIHCNKQDFLYQNIFDNCLKIIELLNLISHSHHYIRFFLDEVLDFLVSQHSTISQFVEWWDKRKEKASLIVPETANAIRIMTIHASKGLEFPIVIIPYCNWLIYKPDNNWVSIQPNQTALPVAVVRLSEKITEAGIGEAYEEEFANQTLDQVNLLYVAFTRAVNQLHIIGSTNEKSRFKSINNWLTDFIKQNGYIKNEDNEIEFGSRIMESDKHQNNSNVSGYDLNPLEFHSPDGLIKIKAAHLNEEIGNARLYGIALHNILSRINNIDEIASAVEKSIHEGEIGLRDKNKILSQLQSVLTHPSLINLYQKELYTSKIEQEILSKEGKVLRPDRIFIGKSETVVLDFKTGQREDQLYLPKMLQYKKVLEELSYPKVRLCLFYIENQELIDL